MITRMSEGAIADSSPQHLKSELHGRARIRYAVWGFPYSKPDSPVTALVDMWNLAMSQPVDVVDPESPISFHGV
ncbi:UNVERIFIED_CONTAM: hypothetical protein K2H54_069104 [Gekko kuhli]